MKCRYCSNASFIPFADLQNCPPSNSMLTKEMLSEPEVYYPLMVEVCDNCFLAQVDEHKRAVEIFTAEYTYFSSYSTSWLDHCRRFAEEAIDRFDLGPSSRVLEVASNDGYLLQYFAKAGVEVLGVEPTANTAAVAQDRGIRTIVDFFGERFAREELASSGHCGDLICANNVFAHVPDINDFTAGLKIALAEGGVISLEFPHLLRLVENTQFDTIYHEHFSYLTLGVTKAIFQSQGLKIFDAERLPTHGGSLRVYGAHIEDTARQVSERVGAVLREEEAAGLTGREVYASFQQRIERIRGEFLEFLLQQNRLGKLVVGYGAAAKGNTLLNYCGIKGNELIRFVADLSPHKQGRFLPGSHIPVLEPDEIARQKPDFVVIFPWNLQEEVIEQLSYIRAWGGKFVVAIPELVVF